MLGVFNHSRSTKLKPATQFIKASSLTQLEPSNDSITQKRNNIKKIASINLYFIIFISTKVKATKVSF